MKTFPDSNRGRWHGIMLACRTLVVLALAMVLGALAGPGDAEASHSGCTKAWIHPSNGSWHDDLNWSGGTVPTANDRVCFHGNYTVTLEGVGEAAGLVIGHGETQGLRLEAGCDGDARLRVGGTVFIDEMGHIAMTNSCPDASHDVTLDADSIVNDGSFRVTAYNGGGRYLRGALENGSLAQVTVDRADLQFDRGEWQNAGTLELGPGASLSVDGARFVQTGGTIRGDGRLRVLGGEFRHAGGTFEGGHPWFPAPPIELVQSSLALDSTDPAAFVMTGWVNTLLSGEVASGQSITVRADCSGPITLVMPNGSTNRGRIELTSECSSGYAKLEAEPFGGTFTNAGTILVSEGAGGERVLRGNLVNTGSVVLDHGVSFGVYWSSSWLNEGSVRISDDATLSVLGSQTSFTNAAGGSIVGQGTGRVSVGSGTFVHGDGTFSGPEPIHLGGSELTITGTTPASYLWQGPGRLTGDVAHGQSIRLLGGCGQPAELRQAGFTNRGTIELTSHARCAGDALINVFGGKLTNLGTLRVLVGAGGARNVAGLLQNQGLLELGAGTTLQTVGYEETAQATFATSVDSASSVGVLSTLAGATLAGTLATARAAPFNPPVGTTIPILNASAVGGAWTNVTGAVIAGSVYFRPTYSPLDASLVVRDAWLSPSPTSGPPGSSVNVRAKSFPANTKVTLAFRDSAGTSRTVGIRMTDGFGSLSTVITVPAAAALGNGRLTATSSLTGVTTAVAFGVL